MQHLRQLNLPPETIDINATNYYINNMGGYINLLAFGVKAKMNNITSNWDMEFEMRISNGKSLYGYDDIAKAEFEVTGGASGTTMFNSSHCYTYDFSEPAIYKAACASSSNPYPILSGQIDIFVTPGNSPLNPEDFPAHSVRMKWEDLQSDCLSRTTMYYNGIPIIL
jgi:hypothetical protein